MRLPRSNLFRVYLAAVMANLAGAILAPVLFLVALFSRRGVFATAAEIVLVASLLGMATIQGWRAAVLLRRGTWTTLDRKQVSREEQPVKFVIWLTLHAVVAAIPMATAAFLTWALLVPKL